MINIEGDIMLPSVREWVDKKVTKLANADAAANKWGVDPPEGHEDDLKMAKADLITVEKKKSNAIEGFFTIYANLFNKDMHYPWTKITGRINCISCRAAQR